MFDLIYESGPIVLSVLTIIFLVMIVTAFVNGLPLLKNSSHNIEIHRTRIGYIKSLGLLALVVGMFGQLIGLYSAFNAMSSLDGRISQQILLSGLKTSLIPTLYGMMIYVISYLIWLGLSWKLRTK